MTPAEDAAAAAGPAEPVTVGTWTYATDNPPYGWPTAEWPTDLPDTTELAEYEARIEPLVTLPSAR